MKSLSSSRNLFLNRSVVVIGSSPIWSPIAPVLEDFTPDYRCQRVLVFLLPPATCRFSNPDLIAYLIHLSDDDIVMPNPATGLQPMHAVYSKACCPHLKRMIESRNLSIQGILQNEGLRVRLVPEEDLRQHDPELLSFLNVQTPEDAERARTLGQGDTRPGNL